MKRFLLTLLALASFSALNAKITLPSLIGDNMVLQRNAKVNVWGWSGAGGKVTVTTSWDGREYRAKADGDGRWLVTVETGDAGGPYTVTVSDGEPVVVRNVLLGEVWICSGQSNMEMPVCGFMYQPVEGSVDAITDAMMYPGIRMFTVKQASVDKPQDNCGGQWETASPKSVANFSATGYFFGRTLSKVLGIPVGLINTSWGGSAIEAWMTTETIDSIEGLDREVLKTWDKDNSTPQRLYNGMVAPLANYTAKGFIWYQGETNLRNWFDYCKLQTAMVGLWRKAWGDDRMPFYFTQLAPYNYGNANGRTLAMTVEAQYRAMELIPYSGIAATTDLGNPTCIHPARKQEVGARLAYLALRNDYGIAGLPAPAPTFRSMERDGVKLVLSFNNLSGKNTWNDPDSFLAYLPDGYLKPQGFEIAGEDRVFHPAKASIQWWVNRIEVSSPEVPEPVAVRYAFRNYCPEANVVTTMGQPLAPFRTDDWKVEDL